MKFQALVVLCSLALANAHALKGEYAGPLHNRHAHIARQQTTSTTTAATPTPTPGAPQPTPASPAPGGPVAAYDPNGIPPLNAITSGMPTGTTYAVSQTFAPGTKPTAITNAPAIPQCESAQHSTSLFGGTHTYISHFQSHGLACHGQASSDRYVSCSRAMSGRH